MIGLKQRQTFQRAVKAGVKMIFGTDAGVYPHGDNAKQFAKMVQWGMTPLQAIQAATLNASQALGRGDVGVIEPGSYGDLVAVRGDPLRDVTVLEHVDAVVKGGRLVKGPGAQ
jgi:imidazolonepropionase-like amidohydrolase